MDNVVKKDYAFSLYIGFVGIAAFVLMLWITPYGSGVSPDSTVYIGGAKSILSGEGFSLRSEPITHFPPLYPLLLAATGLFENNLVQAARFLGAILFGANAALVASAVYLATGRRFLTTTAATLFFLSSAPFITVHSMAWSEPLFITCSLAGLILLSKYVVRPTAFLLVASSLSLGFALVTRYVGVAFLPAALAVLYVGGPGRWFGRRFRTTLASCMLSCLPLGIVLARNVLSGSVTDRGFAAHQASVVSFVKSLVSVAIGFVAPFSLPAGMRLAIYGLLDASLVALLLFFVIFVRRHIRDIDRRSMSTVMILSCLLYAVAYVLFLFVSISFFDAATPVDRRLLSPVFVILIIGAFALAWNVSQTVRRPAILYCFVLLVALSISAKIPEAIHAAVDMRKNGSGYTSREWQDSQGVAYVRRLEEGTRIYSNAADAISFLAGKQCLPIPVKKNPSTMETNPRYTTEVGAMCKDIVGKRALLVYFGRLNWEGIQPTPAELESACRFTALRRFPDAIVYGGRRDDPKR